jgi:hypothetical protein
MVIVFVLYGKDLAILAVDAAIATHHLKRE